MSAVSATRAETPPLVLGTAQLGMSYGIANRRGAPGDEEALGLIARARALAIAQFDTARAYGESERRLGAALATDADARIVTKLAPLDELGPDSQRLEIERAVGASLTASRAALGRERLDTVLLHRAGSENHIVDHDEPRWCSLLSEWGQTVPRDWKQYDPLIRPVIEGPIARYAMP